MDNSEFVSKIIDLVESYNNIFTKKSDVLKIAQKASDMLNDVRFMHGKIINKMMKSNDLNMTSVYYSMASLINDNIFSMQKKLTDFIAENKIDTTKINVKKTNDITSANDIVENNDDSGDELPLFEGEKSPEQRHKDSIHIELKKTDSGLNNYDKSLPSLILFYRPGCPACDKTKPEWNQFVGEINKSVKKDGKIFNIMEYNLLDRSNETLATLFNVEYIPTIVMMESVKMKNAKSKIEKIEGAADIARISEFVTNSYEKFME